jgi:hypothetical protein
LKGGGALLEERFLPGIELRGRNLL